MANRQADRPSADPSPQPQGRGILGMPTWVLVGAVITLAVLLLLGAMMVFGGGQHGPGQHSGTMTHESGDVMPSGEHG